MESSKHTWDRSRFRSSIDPMRPLYIMLLSIWIYHVCAQKELPGYLVYIVYHVMQSSWYHRSVKVRRRLEEQVEVMATSRGVVLPTTPNVKVGTDL